MQRVRRECGIARQDLLLKTIVFEEMRIHVVPSLLVEAKCSQNSVWVQAGLLCSLYDRRAKLFDGYRLRRIYIRIEEHGVVRARLAAELFLESS